MEKSELMKENKRQEIMHRLRFKPFLHMVEQSVYDIPKRVEEYDTDMFVVFNSIKQKYELHSIQYPGDTFQTTIPFNDLDVRALRHLWENDLAVHGKDIFRRIERDEADFKRAKDRDFKNWAQAVASETKSMFAKDAWTAI
jgi:hypothetical protein